MIYYKKLRYTYYIRIIDVYRKRKDKYFIDLDEVSNKIESKDPPLDDIVIRLEETEELSQKPSELKSEYADILTLKYYHQFNDKEIAEILNITNENARIRIYRAKIALKKVMLKDYNPIKEVVLYEK